MTSDKSLVGAAGEHLVLSRLLARGLLASQAPRGTRKADILVPPSLVGADQVAVMVLSDAVAERLVTALGVVTGTTDDDIDEY